MRYRQAHMGAAIFTLVALAGAAQAKVFDLEINSAVGSNTLTTPLANGDGFGVSSFIDDGPGALEHEVRFSVAPGATALRATAVWFVDFDDDSPFDLRNFNLDLTTDDGRVLASDTVLGVSGRAVVSELSFAGLEVGEHYALAITGLLNEVGSYDVKLATTPLPGAVVLFGSAIAGLAAWRRRR